MTNRFIRQFSGLSQRIGNNPFLSATRRGLTLMIPLIMIGSFALIFLSLPVQSYQNLMIEIFGEKWDNLFLYVRDGTFNILSLVMVICVSNSYIIENRELKALHVTPSISAVVSLASFIALSGISEDGFSISNFGVTGSFLAIFVALSSAWIYLKLSSVKWLNKKPYSSPNTTYDLALRSILPAALTIAIFAGINVLLSDVLGISDIQGFISDVFCNLFLRIESPLISGVLFITLIHSLWFLGIHGNNVLEPVTQNLFVPAAAVNQILSGAGHAPTEIFTKTFFDTFVLMGGCGSTLCLICALFIFGHSRLQLHHAKLSVFPVLFNINELIVFGIPIVLNPIYLIPFLCVPLILTLISYFAVSLGIVPYAINIVEWTTPVFLSGYAATGSILGSLLQLFNLAIGTLCYLPFVRLEQRLSTAKMRYSMRKIYYSFKQSEEKGLASNLLARNDDVGYLSKFLAEDLKQALETGGLALHYQPQLDYQGRVTGMEALLRWKHSNYNYIYPPLIIAFAEESNLIDKLGYWMFDTACRDLKKLHDSGHDKLTVSVNVSSVQLESDKFISNLEKIIKKHGIRPGDLKIEITERLALSCCKSIIDSIQAIKDLGIKLEMDDFGMGHSSLVYLKEYQIDAIKLDGSLVRDITSNANCRNIIATIVELGKSMNYNVIAEYVETEEQFRILHELGCDHYQGYYFCKAMPFGDVMEYISKNYKPIHKRPPHAVAK